MKTKWRLILPIFLCVVMTASLAYGGWVWYDANIDRSGWYEENGQRYYLDFYGEHLSGWQEVKGYLYFFREDGSVLTGWQEIGGQRYYLGTDGTMARGWQTVDGSRSYFGADGIQRTGWLELGDGIYYLPEGKMATSWQVIDGKAYYFTQQGMMARGFASIDGERYYFTDEGSMVTGEAELLGQWYYFKENGIMHTGWWETEEGKKYYLPEGNMALGWHEVDGKKYHFGPDGHPVTGWFEEGEYRYYFLEDGSAAVGPTDIDGQLHHFTPKGMEVVLVNAKLVVPSWYQQDLKTVVDHHLADTRCYDALMAMLAGIVDAGLEYEFNSAYRTIEVQKEILESRTQIYMESYELTFEEARERVLRTVALPGTSEHHLGLAVDLLGDEAQTWLHEHCWDYGFIVRYREDKERWTGIASEPWHFRYVGKEVALELKENGLSLEEYLGAEPVKPWL